MMSTRDLAGERALTARPLDRPRRSGRQRLTMALARTHHRSATGCRERETETHCEGGNHGASRLLNRASAGVASGTNV